MAGKKVKRDIKLLKDSLEREYLGITWTWRLGFQQERGKKSLRYAPHIHFLADRPVDCKWIARRWYKIVESGDPRHLKAGTHVDKIIHIGKMINSMVSCMASDNETEVPVGFEDVGRFWGIKKGKKVSWSMRSSRKWLPTE
jgi:hypothetical protein